MIVEARLERIKLHEECETLVGTAPDPSLENRQPSILESNHWYCPFVKFPELQI